MAMTAADRIALRKEFLLIDDYVKDKEAINKRLDKAESCNEANNLALVEIKTELRIVLAVLGAVGIAVLSLVVKQFWGVTP